MVATPHKRPVIEKRFGILFALVASRVFFWGGYSLTVFLIWSEDHFAAVKVGSWLTSCCTSESESDCIVLCLKLQDWSDVWCRWTFRIARNEHLLHLTQLGASWTIDLSLCDACRHKTEVWSQWVLSLTGGCTRELTISMSDVADVVAIQVDWGKSAGQRGMHQLQRFHGVAGKWWLQALKLFVVLFLAPGRCLREKSLRGNMGLLYCHNELDFRSQSCVKTNACDTSHTKLMNIPLTTLLGFSLAPRHQGILWQMWQHNEEQWRFWSWRQSNYQCASYEV